jgi:hypothetical protein
MTFPTLCGCKIIVHTQPSSQTSFRKCVILLSIILPHDSRFESGRWVLMDCRAMVLTRSQSATMTIRERRPYLKFISVTFSLAALRKHWNVGVLTASWMLQVLHLFFWDCSYSGPSIQNLPINALVLVREVGSRLGCAFRPLQRE